MQLSFGWVKQYLLGRRLALLTGLLGLATVASAAIFLPNLFPLPDPTGLVSTYNENGPIDQSTKNPFFRSLGTNGRSCGTLRVMLLG